MLDRKIASPDIPAAEAGGADAAGPRLNGVVDVSRPDRVAGWAIDRADANVAIDVDIFRDGRQIATVRADRHREDLVRNGIGTGNYGFLAELDLPVDPGMTFAVKAVARAADGTRNTLRPIGKAAPSSDPQRRVTERIFEEIVDLRADVARLREEIPGSDESAVQQLREMLDRVEVVQARLEANTSGAPPKGETTVDKGLRAIAATALAIALGSMALGIYSMWFT